MRYLFLMALATVMICGGCSHVSPIGDGGTDTGPAECNLGEYNGDFTISPQSDVADIAGYTSISGDLNVEWISEDLDNESTSYSDLSELICLTSVGEDLVIYFNYALTNLDGLSALTSVGGTLIIENNFALTNLDGLSGITSVIGFLAISGNTALTNIDGLSGITSVGEVLKIVNNATLTNLDGLSAITSAGDLAVWHNNALANLDGVSGLISAGDELVIYDNPNLTDCEVCDLLDQLATKPTLITVYDNLDDSCTPVPAGCP